ncbi:MAG: Acriflavin resistance plasma membrane protein [Comamonadaceae bacterium]|nr:MAG: Acriflavin resistance plasma membrane protein [Comamonadaceae bacterium]
MPEALNLQPRLPATVLAYHPAVLAAAREVDAARADIAVARADRLPRLNLTALLSGQWLSAAGTTLNAALRNAARDTENALAAAASADARMAPARQSVDAARKVLVALLLGHSELDVPSMIGLVMLMGIVTKNSILLVEYAILGMRERGLALVPALIDACHKRARPIVMTTVAMIAGMLPIALGLGADASFRQPMATAVIGGLLTSTALSLLVVPVVFTYVDGFERLLRRGHVKAGARQSAAGSVA